MTDCNFAGTYEIWLEEDADGIETSLVLANSTNKALGANAKLIRSFASASFEEASRVYRQWLNTRK